MAPDAVDLYLNVSQISLDMVKKYFGMKAQLYFDFTHLVCRTAFDGQ